MNLESAQITLLLVLACVTSGEIFDPNAAATQWYEPMGKAGDDMGTYISVNAKLSRLKWVLLGFS